MGLQTLRAHFAPPLLLKEKNICLLKFLVLDQFQITITALFDNETNQSLKFYEWAILPQSAFLSFKKYLKKKFRENFQLPRLFALTNLSPFSLEFLHKKKNIFFFASRMVSHFAPIFSVQVIIIQNLLILI